MISISKQFSSMTVATILLLFFCLLGFPRVASHADCVPHERAALLEFRGGIHQLHARDSLNSWKGLNCCAWQGIECSQSTGNIITLDLYDQRLTGNISSSLAKLQFLEYLDLSWNIFTGVIPHQIGTLIRLQYLDLSQINKDNYLEDLDWSLYPGDLESRSIAWVGNLSKLAYLSLDSVNLSAWAFSTWRFPNNIPPLQYLSMSFCSLAGAIPSSLYNLTSLAYLDVSGNDFPSYNVSQVLSAAAQYFPHLTHLLMLRTGIGGMIPSSLANVTSLTDLDLSQNRIEGVIPRSIANLSTLHSLDLSFNKLSGPIPTAVANLCNLSSLILDHNSLSGSIPPSVGNIPLLTDIYLNDNTLSGSIPHSFNNLSSLRSLCLQNNQLNGSIPSFFAFHSEFRIIDLSGNSFTDTVSLSLLQHLPHLRWFGLSHNHFTVNTTLLSIPAFQLEVLGLATCNIVGEFPSFISTQYDLISLDLSNNRLVGNIPSWLWDLPELLSLNLSYNVFQGRLPPALNSSPLKSLDLKNNSLEGPLPLPPPEILFLDLSGNQFSGFIAPEIGNHINGLQFLSLSKNKLSGAIPSHVCQWGSQGLKVLDLSDNRFSSIARPGLQNCSSLSVLNLGNNHLKYRDITERLGTLPSLSTLLVNSNQLNGYFPVSVRMYTKLKMINLSENSIRGSIPWWIGDLKDLRVLLLRSNKLSGHIPSQITLLHKLQIVDLSFNNLQGEIPKNLTDLHAMIHPLTNMHSLECRYTSIDIANSYSSIWTYIGGSVYSWQKYEDEADLTNKGQQLHYVERILSLVALIDLSNNNLSGEIPTEIGVLKGLRVLNISANLIRGQIPETLKDLWELESLDVSHNELHGRIPSQLQSITSLEVFDVSYNNLSGRIPVENQFLTFKASMFEGNKYLCGIQVNRTCGDGTDNWSPPPENKNDDVEEEAEKFEIPWWNVGVGLSFAVGFSSVCFVLAVNRRWRSEYFRVMDGIAIGLLEWLGIM